MLLLTHLSVVVISYAVSLSTFQMLVNEEADVILSTLKFLKIAECILTSETRNGTLAKAAKKLAHSSILTGFMKPTMLSSYISLSKPPGSKIAIVVKVKEFASVKQLFIENFKRLFWFTWFVISDDGFSDEIRIPFNSLFLVMKKGNNGMYQILENYHLKNSSTFSNEYGLWSPGKGLNATSLNFYERRMNMKGVELVRTDSENNIKCDKYVIEHEARVIWSDLSRILNFSMKVVDESMNKGSEENVPDGSSCIWGITGLDFNKDWIFSNFGICARIITKFRSSNEVGWMAYVRPFKNDMWTAIGIWLFLSTAAIVIVRGTTRETLFHNIFTAFFCLCNSDPMATHPANAPIPLPTKLAYLMALTVPAVIIPAYSAYILATLSIVLPVEPFNSLQSFIEDGTFNLTTVTNTFMIRFLNGSEDTEIKHINNHFFVGPEKTASSFSELFKEVCENNRLAGLFIDSTAYRNAFPCKMFVMQSEVTCISSGFLLQKGSPFQKLFNEMFSRYGEKGILQRVIAVKKKVPLYLSNLKGETDKLSSLNLFQMYPVFLLIPLGVILSLIVLAAEVAHHKKQNRVKVP